MDRCVLGLDTSCYTTSVALVSSQGVKGDFRSPLSVKPGEKGLRQSEALFQHVKNLPDLFERIQEVPRYSIAAVAASSRPRPQEGSYMPVFTAGAAFARTVASALAVPFFETTHQEGHLEAGLRSCGGSPSGPMLALHLSGGTSEVLRAARGLGGWDIALLGGTQDLSAGQFIDRVGQALGLPFPAGPSLERLAANGSPGRFVIPAPVRGYEVSFSGPTTAALRAIGEQGDPGDIALAVFLCIARSLQKVIGRAAADLGLTDVLLVGGVSANALIRDKLQTDLAGSAPGVRVHFADPRSAIDNAVGVAYLGLDHLERSAGPRTPHREG